LGIIDASDGFEYLDAMVGKFLLPALGFGNSTAAMESHTESTATNDSILLVKNVTMQTRTTIQIHAAIIALLKKARKIVARTVKFWGVSRWCCNF
jgi:hypothetical protein